MTIRHDRFRIWFPIALSLFALALYWRLFSLLFFWDDAPHFLTYIQPTFADIWANRNGYGYYRPLGFTFYKIAYQWLAWTPFYFYVAEMAMHCASGVLIGRIVRRLMLPSLGSSPADLQLANWYAAAASILFVTYPFSVITLTNIAAMIHPAVTLLTLLAIWAMFHYVDQEGQGRRGGWLLLASICTLCSPFMHENGVTTGTLVSLLLIALLAQRAWRYRWILLLFPLLNLFFIPIWLSVPKANRGVSWVGWESIGSSISFFVQGFTYIFQPLAQRLVLRGWPEMTTIWTTALICLLAAALVLGYRRHWRILFVSFGWLAISMVPSVIGLPYSYIYPSMRLHYFPGVAAVFLMSASAITLAQSFRSPRLRQLAAALVIALGVAIPSVFIWRSLVLHEFALEPIRQMTEIVKQNPTDKYLLINGLDWISYRSTWYPLGHEGAEVMPEYVLPSQIVAINGRMPVTMQEIVYPPLQDRLEHYYYGLNREEIVRRDANGVAEQILQSDRVLLMLYAPEGITVHDVGTVKAGDALIPTTYLANFEGKIFLQSASKQLIDRTLHLQLAWKYLGSDPDATIFRHVLDCEGNLVAQADGDLLGRAMPIALLPAGAEVRDERAIPLDKLSPSGCYRVEVGLYRPDGTRLVSSDSQQQPFENSVVVIP